MQLGLKQELAADMICVRKNLEELMAAPPESDAATEVMKAVSESKGKGLRPQLLLMAGRCGPKFREKRERLRRLAALVEMVHMASLIHDDIVDDSPLRRGKPSIQSLFGKDMAVYAGDLLLSRIVQELFRAPFSEAGVLFGETVEEMCKGELGQMAVRYSEDVTPDAYMRNIYGKTASLCKLACSAGAIESGCSAEVREHLENLGVHFGYMFQIRDDYLDFVSSGKKEGKPTQMDFKEGILTLPVLFAMENSEACRRIRGLIRVARAGEFGENEAKELRDLVAGSGGLKRALEEINFHMKKVRDAADALPSGEVTKMVYGILAKLEVS